MYMCIQLKQNTKQNVTYLFHVTAPHCTPSIWTKLHCGRDNDNWETTGTCLGEEDLFDPEVGLFTVDNILLLDTGRFVWPSTATWFDLDQPNGILPSWLWSKKVEGLEYQLFNAEFQFNEFASEEVAWITETTTRKNILSCVIPHPLSSSCFST